MLIKQHTMKTYSIVEVKFYAFLMAAQDLDRCLVLHPNRFEPRKLICFHLMLQFAEPVWIRWRLEKIRCFC